MHIFKYAFYFLKSVMKTMWNLKMPDNLHLLLTLKDNGPGLSWQVDI